MVVELAYLKGFSGLYACFPVDPIRLALMFVLVQLFDDHITPLFYKASLVSLHAVARIQLAESLSVTHVVHHTMFSMLQVCWLWQCHMFASDTIDSANEHFSNCKTWSASPTA